MSETSGLRRAIDLRAAISINVITMIGIGPLVTIPLVIAALGGPLALVGWVAGAIVALCDGLVWAELSSHMPGSGGTYVYLREAFGPQRLGRALAFLFNWQFLLYAPCLLASGYIGFANYAAYLYPPLASGAAHDATAVAIGIVTIALLYRRTAHVATVGTILAVAAAATVALVALAGLTHGNLSRVFHLDAPVRFGAGLVAGFGSALYITLYDYVGYADAALLGDEVRRPERTIPLAIVLSVLAVAVLYIALQLGVLGVIPWRSLLDARGAPTVQAQYVGSLVIERTWGRTAAIGITLLVLVTAFASLYGNLLGFSRIPFAAARDGAFLPSFARLHTTKGIPHVALLAVGGLSLAASFFTLDQVIAFLTAGIVLVQGVAQILALVLMRSRRKRAPFTMPLYPLPAAVALAGWGLAFVSSGALAIALGVGWLALGAVVFLIAAHRQRWWPFALAALLVAALPTPMRAATTPEGWSNWNAAAVRSERGYPVFTVDGRPFFVYGAAFFYERIPHDRWRAALQAYRALGINTIDLYLIWNWHEPTPGLRDFTGATDPRRDLAGLLKLTHELGFKLVLRPGPVIRNEWRNGGYPAWLLERPEYDMPLHDVLEGRYPATATLQNAHADAAGAAWLANGTHRTYAAEWLRDVLQVCAPYAGDVIAIALDDDQGAYLDNDTWPGPNWRAYVGWLRAVVRAVAGARVPVFVNTYEMKVTAASPVWAWGDWYQSDALQIGPHDLAQLDFATGLLQTQTRFPVMQAEFQAGWLQGAEEGAPRPSDPSNTTLALNELLRDGAHGIVNFPLQDTIYPDGWEAPWANWSYAWDAALTSSLDASARYAPTRRFGDDVLRYGALLARTHVAADAAIVWPPTLFPPGSLSNANFLAFAGETIAAQRDCNARGLTCVLVDLTYSGGDTLRRYSAVLLPFAPEAPAALPMTPEATRRLAALRRSGRLVRTLARVRSATAGAGPDSTVLLADDGSYAFVDAVNPSDAPRTIPAMRIALSARRVVVPAFSLAARSAKLVPVGLPAQPGFPALAAPAPAGTPPPFSSTNGLTLQTARLRVALASDAGARLAELSAGTGNAASSIGLLRDAVDPAPPASARDYIAAYTHPLAAGTFNRSYDCRAAAGVPPALICRYDAPDLPAGGAVFQRTLRFENDGTLVVDETYAPHDAADTTRLESISGFSFEAGDATVPSSDGDAIGILHGTRIAIVRWRTGDVARMDLRRTRGAQILTLVFARRSVELRLSVAAAGTVAEARRLVDANQP